MKNQLKNLSTFLGKDHTRIIEQMQSRKLKDYYRNNCKRIANFLAPTPLNTDLTKWEKKNKWLRRAGIKVGKGVAIDHSFTCLTGLEDNIIIEDYAALGIGLKIWNYNEVIIGTFSMFASDVTLVNGGHNPNTFLPFSGPLKIGKGCWIGIGAKIIGPLTIGNNAIVGAGAVVIKDVPESAIVVGVPAKVIGYRELPEKIWHLGDIYFSPNTFQIME